MKEKTVDPEYAKNRLSRKNKKFIHSVFGTHDGFCHEDLLLDSLLSFKKKGFYVEIGSNDPGMFPSHTTLFYLRGWTGINVEPQTEVFEKLKESRKRDINLNLCIGQTRGTMPFYIVENRTNGSSLNINMAKKSNAQSKSMRVKNIKVIPLAEMFETYASSQEIDFMSVDVEGQELEVLKGNNWNKFRPKALIVETVHYHYAEIVDYLQTVDYVLVYNNEINSIFIDAKQFKDDPRFDVKTARIWRENEEKIPSVIASL